jgi:phosphoserine phosphatase
MGVFVAGLRDAANNRVPRLARSIDGHTRIRNAAMRHIIQAIKQSYLTYFVLWFASFGLHYNTQVQATVRVMSGLQTLMNYQKEFGQKGCIQSGTQDLAVAPSASHQATNPSGVGHTRADDNNGRITLVAASPHHRRQGRPLPNQRLQTKRGFVPKKERPDVGKRAGGVTWATRAP